MNLTISVKDVTNYPTPDAIAATGTNITVNGVTNSNVASAIYVITNNTQVTVSITKSGYYTYTNSFPVYDYDLTVPIILVPIITNNTDPNYRKPYPFFSSYSKPCSFTIACINTSSQPFGTINYFLNGTLKDTNTNTFIDCTEAGTFSIKQEIVVNSLPGESTGSWDLNISNSNTISEYRPQLSLLVTTAASLPPDPQIEAVIGEQITVIPTYSMNNTEGSSCVNGTLTYKIYDSNGTQIGNTLSYTIDIASPQDPSLLEFTFTPATNGDFKLVATLSNCCSTTTITKIITASSFLTITQNGHISTLINSSLTQDVTVTIYDKTGTSIVQNSVIVNKNSTYNITFTSDGIYIIKIFAGTTQYNFIICDYTDLRSCLETLAQKVLCDNKYFNTVTTTSNNTIDNDGDYDQGSGGSCCEDCRENDRYTLNKMVVLGTTYFSYLQGIYGFNNIFLALSDSQIQDLYNIDYVFSIMQKICNCNISTDNFGCGCS